VASLPTSCASAHGAPADADADTCRALMLAQQAAWNAGDLDGFLAGYENGADIVFASAAGTHVGFDSLRQRYRDRYPDRDAMGRLAFDDLVFTRLGVDTLSATGSS
jgi:hypothetical protein